MTPEQTNLLWEKCCNEVANKWGYEDYNDVVWRMQMGDFNVRYFIKEAALLFATEVSRDTSKRAIELARWHGPMLLVPYTEQEILEKLNLSTTE